MKVEEARNILINNEITNVAVIRHGSGLIKFLVHDPKRQDVVIKLQSIFPEIITDQSFGITNLYHK
jgi:hypothetical protein